MSPERGLYPRYEAEAIVEAIETPSGPGDVLPALAAQPNPVLLDSTAFDETNGRFAVAACRPLDVLTLQDGVLHSRQHGLLADRDNSAIWAAFDACFESTRTEPDRQVPYAPGWIGYLGYELGRHIERLPGHAANDTALPDVRLAFYDSVAVFDAIQRKWFLHSLRFKRPRAGAGDAREALRRILTESPPGSSSLPAARTDQADATLRPAANAQSPFSPKAYQDAVARCIDYIAAGDIFQVNLSQRFRIDVDADPLEIYRVLRRRNPAWYSAYLQFEAAGHRCAVLSSSPELFLSVRQRRVITRPIKGTRRRIGRPDVDARAAADLLASSKDNAELAMIIDLLRNDLGRVCRYNTIRVTDPRRLETHPTVFHLVGTVEGELYDGVGQADLLKATFPGGSITGAPKIRSMEIIDELEPAARGVYTGCIGQVGTDGQATWNIAIRTIICDEQAAYVQVGGGIVADSNPAAEHQETLDKARALLEALAEAPVRAASVEGSWLSDTSPTGSRTDRHPTRQR